MKFKTAMITPLVIGIPLLLGGCTQKALAWISTGS